MAIPEFSASGEVCIPNISKAERLKRLAGGMVQMVIALVILLGLMFFGLNRWWRLATLPFLAGSASGFFQWRDKT